MTKLSMINCVYWLIIYVQERGGGYGQTSPPFWRQILYISYLKFQKRDHCKKNIFAKKYLKRPPCDKFLPLSLSMYCTDVDCRD